MVVLQIEPQGSGTGEVRVCGRADWLAWRRSVLVLWRASADLVQLEERGGSLARRRILAGEPISNCRIAYGLLLRAMRQVPSSNLTAALTASLITNCLIAAIIANRQARPR